MSLGFIIWSIMSLLLVVFGIHALCSREPVGFWAGTKAPKVKDIKGYNRAVAVLWFVFALLLELMGVPLIHAEQNSAAALLPIFLTPAWVIALAVTYMIIESKFRDRSK